MVLSSYVVVVCCVDVGDVAIAVDASVLLCMCILRMFAWCISDVVVLLSLCCRALLSCAWCCRCFVVDSCVVCTCCYCLLLFVVVVCVLFDFMLSMCVVVSVFFGFG